MPLQSTACRRPARCGSTILEGEHAKEIAVEQPREFDFVINLKTAESLGLSVPAATLLQATDLVR